jgi:hypothetical protein
MSRMMRVRLIRRMARRTNGEQGMNFMSLRTNRLRMKKCRSVWL